MAMAVVGSGYLVIDGTCGAVDYNVAGITCEALFQTKCNRIFFANISPLFVNQCQSICVRVLAKSKVATGGLYLGRNVD